MQLNLKQPKLETNNNYNMEDKKVNWVNIVIAIAIIGLLLFGVYLINQSIKEDSSDTASNTTRTSVSNTPTRTTTTNTEEEVDDEDEASDSENTTEDSTSSTNSNSQTEDSTTSTNTETDSTQTTTDSSTDATENQTPTSTQTPTTNQPATSSNEIVPQSELAENEIVFKVLKISEKDEEGFFTARFLILQVGSQQEGLKFLVENQETVFTLQRFNIETGKTYRATGFVESGGGVTISNSKLTEISV